MLSPSGTPTQTTDYVSGFRYEDQLLREAQHAEGRVFLTGDAFRYDYVLRDHLGNTRLLFSDTDGDGCPEALQVYDYYPFGLGHATGTAAPGADYQYLYNGKELQEELGLGWYDYGARFYQPETGRWNGVDALGELFLQFSTYTYALNSPVLFVDPDGNQAVASGGEEDPVDDTTRGNLPEQNITAPGSGTNGQARMLMAELETMAMRSAMAPDNSNPLSRYSPAGISPLDYYNTRTVNLEVTNEVTGAAALKSYPVNDGVYYVTPLYRAILSGYNADGIFVSENYDVVRFGVVKKEGQAPYMQDVMTGSIGAQPFEAVWVEGAIQAPGAWRINNSRYFVHVGVSTPFPRTLTSNSVMGNKGCIAICGQINGQFAWHVFTNSVQTISGARSLSETVLSVSIQADPIPPTLLPYNTYQAMDTRERRTALGL